jgi:hypothetical protein
MRVSAQIYSSFEQEIEVFDVVAGYDYGFSPFAAWGKKPYNIRENDIGKGALRTRDRNNPNRPQFHSSVNDEEVVKHG